MNLLLLSLMSTMASISVTNECPNWCGDPLNTIRIWTDDPNLWRCELPSVNVTPCSNVAEIGCLRLDDLGGDLYLMMFSNSPNNIGIDPDYLTKGRTDKLSTTIVCKNGSWTLPNGTLSLTDVLCDQYIIDVQKAQESPNRPLSPLEETNSTSQAVTSDDYNATSVEMNGTNGMNGTISGSTRSAVETSMPTASPMTSNSNGAFEITNSTIQPADGESPSYEIDNQEFSNGTNGMNGTISGSTRSAVETSMPTASPMTSNSNGAFEITNSTIQPADGESPSYEIDNQEFSNGTNGMNGTISGSTRSAVETSMPTASPMTSNSNGAFEITNSTIQPADGESPSYEIDNQEFSNGTNGMNGTISGSTRSAVETSMPTASPMTSNSNGAFEITNSTIQPADGESPSYEIDNQEFSNGTNGMNGTISGSTRSAVETSMPTASPMTSNSNGAFEITNSTIQPADGESPSYEIDNQEFSNETNGMNGTISGSTRSAVETSMPTASPMTSNSNGSFEITNSTIQSAEGESPSYEIDSQEFSSVSAFPLATYQPTRYEIDNQEFSSASALPLATYQPMGEYDTSSNIPASTITDEPYQIKNTRVDGSTRASTQTLFVNGYDVSKSLMETTISVESVYSNGPTEQQYTEEPSPQIIADPYGDSIQPIVTHLQQRKKKLHRRTLRSKRPIKPVKKWRRKVNKLRSYTKKRHVTRAHPSIIGNRNRRILHRRIRMHGKRGSRRSHSRRMKYKTTKGVSPRRRRHQKRVLKNVE